MVKSAEIPYLFLLLSCVFPNVSQAFQQLFQHPVENKLQKGYNQCKMETENAAFFEKMFLFFHKMWKYREIQGLFISTDC